MDTLNDNTPESIDEGSSLSILKQSSLTAEVERELEKLLLNGELKPGERLNEIQLAKRFGVSRGPVREAARSLTARGLTETIRNRGVFVRSISLSEALEIYDLRAAIFGLAGRLVTDLLTDDLMLTLTERVDAMDRFAASGDFDAYYPTNLQFHANLIDATKNATLKREYYSLVNKIHMCRAKGLVHSGGLLISNREHRDMVDSLASGDKFRAQESFFRHVERAKIRFQKATQADTD
jgi:DNA-binding GntR family transcriptional regulator